MKVDGRFYRTIWLNDDGWSVEIIDQTRLPHAFETVTLTNLEEAAQAIRAMLVRGAPLIGATAAYGVCLAMRADDSDAALERACDTLYATRPTAVNLRWTRCARPCATCRAANVSPWLTSARPRSATRMSRSASPSAATD
jgi:methylthioribose-1-phosphate isomerase